MPGENRVSFRGLIKDASKYSRGPKQSDDECRMRILLEWFASRPAESTMAHEIDQGFAQRKWQAATCNRSRALLSCAYRIGVRNGKIAENPIPKMARRRESNNRIRF